MSWAASASAQPSSEAGAEGAEVHVGVGGEHLGERGEPGGAHERIAVEGPLVGGAPGDDVHHVGPAAEGGRGRPAADRLREAGQVGLHAVALDRPARRDRRARFHLVEDEQRAVPVEELEEPGEVAGLGNGDADVHHHRFDDQARDGVADVVEQLRQHGEVVERDRVRVAAQILRNAERHRLRCRRFASAHQICVRNDGEHHGVVVPVIRAFDLHDVVAAGRRARDTDRAHRRFGAGVGEANLFEPEPAAELLGEQDRIFGRRREV